MEEPQTAWKRKVFRLQHIPASIATCTEVSKLLVQILGDGISEHDIRVASLAAAVDWTASQYKVATLQFRTVPTFFKSRLSQTKWSLPMPSDPAKIQPGLQRLILDSDFLGLTPLRDVDPNNHDAE